MFWRWAQVTNKLSFNPEHTFLSLTPTLEKEKKGKSKRNDQVDLDVVCSHHSSFGGEDLQIGKLWNLFPGCQQLGYSQIPHQDLARRFSGKPSSGCLPTFPQFQEPPELSSPTTWKENGFHLPGKSMCDLNKSILGRHILWCWNDYPSLSWLSFEELRSTGTEHMGWMGVQTGHSGGRAAQAWGTPPSLGITLASGGSQAADRRLNHFLRASRLPAPAGFDISAQALTDRGLVLGRALEAHESLFKLLLSSVDLLSLLASCWSSFPLHLLTGHPRNHLLVIYLVYDFLRS